MPDSTLRRSSLQPRQGGKTGAAPGTVDPGAEHDAPVIDIIAFSDDGLVEQRVQGAEEIAPILDRWDVTWVNVDGLGDADLIRDLGALFGLHPLALEDVVHVHQRPKVEDYGDHEYVVIRMCTLDRDLCVEQISLFFGQGFVLTFQEHRGDCLDPLRRRIREGLGRVRASPSDYLAYAVLDTVIDGYFPVLEEYGVRLEALEDVVLERPERSVLGEIRDLRHNLLELGRTVSPLPDAVAMLRRETNPHISADTRPYLRACHDHAIRVRDLVDHWRDLTSGLMDIYLSAASHRMNEVAQVLTVIGAVFIPLTFVTGLYGMNFEHMPELAWPYAYPTVLLVMAAVSAGLLLWFRRKQWL